MSKPDNNTHHHSHHSHHDSTANVITDHDTEDSFGFDVDWDAIESNYQRRRRRRHHHSSRSSSNKESNEDANTNSKKKKRRFSKLHKIKKKFTKKISKWSTKKKILVSIGVFLLCILIGAISAFTIMFYQGKSKMLNYSHLDIKVPEGIAYKDGGEIVTYNGHKYRFNKNLASILFMGIDNRELVDNATSGTAGQADALYLFTYDTSTGEVKTLSLNRDTMTDIDRYDTDGNFHDSVTAQLCLAYAFGDGKTLSAENQVKAVQRLLYNVPINAYYAIDISAIKILNDDIGGVTLIPEYTFGSFTKGQEITIIGDMAEEYVRTRNTEMLDDNLRRMACQRQYIEAFGNQIVPAIKRDFRTPIKLYQDSSEYTVTNINMSVMTYVGSTLALNYKGLQQVSTEGKYYDVKDDEFAEFKVDKDKLFETVLDMFYTKIQ